MTTTTTTEATRLNAIKATLRRSHCSLALGPPPPPQPPTAHTRPQTIVLVLTTHKDEEQEEEEDQVIPPVGNLPSHGF
ncbi:hypothetical protein SprV_0902669900 [Sparganum proliferum]